VFRLGDEQVEDVVRERVRRRVPVEDQQVAVGDADASFQDQLAEQRRGQSEPGGPRMQPGPAGAVLVCDQKILVSQHAFHAPLKLDPSFEDHCRCRKS